VSGSDDGETPVWEYAEVRAQRAYAETCDVTWQVALMHANARDLVSHGGCGRTLELMRLKRPNKH